MKPKRATSAVRRAPLLQLAFLCFAFLLLQSGRALADEDYLSADQITALLSERVVEGEQNGRRWRQSFSKQGATVYSEAGRADSPGRWSARGDAEGGLYCSLWPPSDRWDCYRMIRDGDNVSWIPLGGGDVWPGKLVPQ